MTFDTAAAANAAINNLQDTDLMGRPIFLREDREDAGFGVSGGFGGGFGGGGGGGSFGGGGSVKCKVTKRILSEQMHH